MAAEQPDIVLAGTTLPQVNGYDLARYMRGRPELRGVPVLLLHVAEFPQANRLRFFAGADRGQKFLFEEEHGDSDWSLKRPADGAAVGPQKDLESVIDTGSRLPLQAGVVAL